MNVKISEELLDRTLKTPDWTEFGDDTNLHYFKPIEEHENRVLHIVVNHHVLPNKIVTLFFDRRAAKRNR